MKALLYLVPIAALWGGKIDRINLADFGQVVEFSGQAGEIPKAEPIERGPDGWETYQAENGQRMIGLEWDEPRDVAEVNIEFRHAIANREQIKVQYFQYHRPVSEKSDEGNWITPKVAEWWAGDRDISFTFVPLAVERPDQEGSDATFRRTSRLRFLLGKEDLPRVRYIRAYGPNKPAEAIFNIKVPADRLTPPYQASIVNGNLVEIDEAGKRTMSQSLTLEEGPIGLRIIYARSDSETPTRTQVTIRGGEAQEPVMFSPVAVAAKGKLELVNGVIVEFRKADSPATNRGASAPSAAE